MGRRYQPGGIPLASQVGDSLEFVGTREYREGDPLRKIHWRSWGRVGPARGEGVPGGVLLADRARPRHLPPAAAAARASASASRRRSRSWPRWPSTSAAARRSSTSSRPGPTSTRSAPAAAWATSTTCSTCSPASSPRPRRPSSRSGPPLFERLERLTTVVAVMLEWDDAREAFLRRVRAMGVAVRVLLVHEGETRKPWASVSADLGEIARFTPAQVEARLAAEEARVRRVRPTAVRVGPRGGARRRHRRARLSLCGDPRPRRSSPALVLARPVHRVRGVDHGAARASPASCPGSHARPAPGRSGRRPGSAARWACSSSTRPLVPLLARPPPRPDRHRLRARAARLPARAHAGAGGDRRPRRRRASTRSRAATARSALPFLKGADHNAFADLYLPLAVVVLVALWSAALLAHGPRWRARDVGDRR